MFTGLGRHRATSGSATSGGPRTGAWESRTLGEFLDAAGRDPVDAIADLILAEDLCANMIVPGPHLDGIRTFLRHPSGMVGSDAILIADKPSPRTYGTFPRLLGQFVRDEGLSGSRRRCAG